MYIKFWKQNCLGNVHFKQMGKVNCMSGATAVPAVALLSPSGLHISQGFAFHGLFLDVGKDK